VYTKYVDCDIVACFNIFEMHKRWFVTNTTIGEIMQIEPGVMKSFITGSILVSSTEEVEDPYQFRGRIDAVYVESDHVTIVLSVVAVNIGYPAAAKWMVAPVNNREHPIAYSLFEVQDEGCGSSGHRELVIFAQTVGENIVISRCPNPEDLRWPTNIRD
jgi:hypothetical protein